MIILRGLPGSGKSTLARKVKDFLPQAEICSADLFFTDHQSGEYRFDRSQLSEAHSSCKKAAESLCQVWSPVIVIDNTNVQKFEIFPYIQLANRYRYSVLVLETSTPWAKNAEELARRNTHGVTKEVIAKRLRQWQPFPPLYYGWFLHLTDSHLLLKNALSSLTNVLSYVQDWPKCLPSTASELSSRYQRLWSSGPSREILHCTSCYLGRSQRQQAKKYLEEEEEEEGKGEKREEVENASARAAGRVFPLKVVSLFLTSRTWGAAVDLSKEPRDLWLEGRQSPSSSIPAKLQPSKSSSGRTPHGVKKKQEEEVVDLEGGFEVCQPTMRVQSQTATEEEEHRRRRRNTTTGRRAHITLGRAEGVRPVQAGVDLEDILDELDLVEEDCGTDVEGGRLYLPSGKAVFLELKQPITFTSLFTGSY